MKTLLIALALLQAPTGDVPDFSSPWTLEQCTQWALDHNLTVAARALSVESQEIEKNSAAWSFAPSVSASASENWSFGRGLGGNNTYESGNTSSFGTNLGASMTLFDGLATPRRLQLAQLNLEAATADLESARENIRVNVAKAYVQILYNYEIADVAREQLAIDSLQVERLEGLFASGMASSADVSQQRASLAQSRVTLVQAQNNVRSALLDLAQLLEFPAWEGFSIVRPILSVEDLYLGTPDDIYADALGLRPSIRAEQLRLQGAQKSVQIAKSAIWPTLSLSGGLSTNYYNSSFNTQGFWDQLNTNFSQYVGLSLNIPIFTRMNTRNSIRSAKVQAQSQALQLRQAQQSLYKEIQQAWNSAVAAQAKYDSALVAADAAADAFELMTGKYENGKATLTEFNEARNRVVKAKSDAVQATCEYLFQTRLVEFYRSGTLTL